MLEIKGNVWEIPNAWVGVTTNGFVTNHGQLVMGGGIALEAVGRFPAVRRRLGTLVREYGNHVYFMPEYGIFSFPTKEHPSDPSPLELVTRSCLELRQFMVSDLLGDREVCLVPPGCGLGGLDYQTQVRPVLKDIFRHLPLTIVDFE